MAASDNLSPDQFEGEAEPAASKYSVQYKRTPRSHTFAYDDTPADWTEAYAHHYAKAKTLSHPDVDVTLWKNDEHILAVYRNGKRA